MKLEFTQSAVRDLQRLQEFIAIKNPQAAKRISQQLRQAITEPMGSVIDFLYWSQR